MKKNIVLRIFIVLMLCFILTACSFNINLSSSGSGTYDAQKVNVFKNYALTTINSSEDLYSELTMQSNLYDEYETKSQSGNYSGICVTVKGIVNNGYLIQDTDKYKGVIFIEIPEDGSGNKYITWYHDENYAISGIEKDSINKLKFSSGSSKLAVTNDFTEIDELLNQVSNDYSITFVSDSDRGGTGETYSNVTCIDEKI